jgi:flagellar basal-body rod modification protein FlgD
MSITSVQNPNMLAGSADVATGGSEAMDKQAFMKLLVAQLKNQDPLDPMDGRDFITQLSQLTGVEKLSSLSDQISSLQVATAGMANTQTSGLVGKHIEAKGDAFLLNDIGAGQSAFNIQEPANVKVKIVNEAGTVVKELDMGDITAGSHEITWDGKLESGDRAPAGRYHVQIEAKNASGAKVSADTDVTGIVDSISYENGYPELVIGNRRVALGNVTTISN